MPLGKTFRRCWRLALMGLTGVLGLALVIRALAALVEALALLCLALVLASLVLPRRLAVLQRLLDKEYARWMTPKTEASCPPEDTGRAPQKA